jgi:hypothetical protein
MLPKLQRQFVARLKVSTQNRNVVFRTRGLLELTASTTCRNKLGAVGDETKQRAEDQTADVWDAEETVHDQKTTSNDFNARPGTPSKV